MNFFKLDHVYAFVKIEQKCIYLQKVQNVAYIPHCGLYAERTMSMQIGALCSLIKGMKQYTNVTIQYNTFSSTVGDNSASV